MRTIRLAAVAAAVLVLGLAAFQLAAGPTPAVKWGPAPPFFPAGARFAVVQGDPSGSGVYTVRLEMPAGYVIKPHWHPTDEYITVLSGRFLVGMGDSVDTKQAMALGQDGFATAPAQAHHFAVAARKTVVQVHGMGPFAITYVRPTDDPRGTTASQ
ncbi:MAG TPA: cupin domain-containing protein [Gemmatimonadales bacterium]|nr:cupin domain-containing protein [Gemmatimonadales bacterium]